MNKMESKLAEFFRTEVVIASESFKANPTTESQTRLETTKALARLLSGMLDRPGFNKSTWILYVMGGL